MSQRARPEHDHERQQVIPFYAGLGVDCFATSARVWAKGVSPGIPDLICFWPKLGFHFFHETKLPPNRQSEAQRDFERACIGTNVPYVLGGIDEAMAFVVFLELAQRVGPTVRIKPRSEWPSHGFDDLGTEWFGSKQQRRAVLQFGYKRAA
jgi:hypothetical protein